MAQAAVTRHELPEHAASWMEGHVRVDLRSVEDFKRCSCGVFQKHDIEDAAALRGFLVCDFERDLILAQNVLHGT